MTLHPLFAWKKSPSGKGDSRPGPIRRRAFRALLEVLEQRLAPATSGLAATLTRAAVAKADVTWLNDVAAIVLNTTLPPGFVAQTAGRLSRGLLPTAAMLQLLGTPPARLATTQQYIQMLLGQGVTSSALSGTGSSRLPAGRPAQLLARIAASTEYYDRSGGIEASYQAALAREFLGSQVLPPALAKLPVQSVPQRLRLVGRLFGSPRFDRVWTGHLAAQALQDGQFPATLIQAATRQLRQPDGFRLVLARFLATPQSRQDVLRLAQLPAPPSLSNPLTIGPTLPSYFGVSQQGLVPDSITDPPAYDEVSTATAASFGVPMSSPWGNGIVFPEVPYATIMGGAAVQPTLQLPSALDTSWPSNVGTGITFQLWFQAKGPGALLSETLALDGYNTQAPLVYINSQDKLVAGLFDGTKVTPNPYQTVFNWTPSGDAVGGDPATVAYQVGAARPLVSQSPVLDNTWHHVAFVVEGQTETLYLDGLLQGQIQGSSSSFYSFTPTLATSDTLGPPLGFSVGGTTFPEPNTTPTPQINYPQGFIGTIDEVAAWTTALSQAQVQEAMTTPVLADSDLAAGLLDDFNFDQTSTNSTWYNQAPGGTGTAIGPTAGTLLVQVPTTISTDPFSTSPRLPGARSWGIQLMTPLAAPAVSVGNSPVTYKVGLAAGDQLEISVPDQSLGNLTIQAESDLGVVVSSSITGGGTTYLQAKRTGTLDVTLTWTPDGSQTAMVTLSDIPGPLNSLMGMLNSYQSGGSLNTEDTQNVIYSYAYADPSLPGVNPNAGSLPTNDAPASYWPLWTDTRYFPVPSGTNPATWAAGLATAYQTLVNNNSLGSSGFANIIGLSFSNNTIVSQLQSALDGAYQSAYGALPALPLTPPAQPFHYQPDSPQQEVYYFFYIANQMRQQVASVLNGSGAGSFPTWVQSVINAIGSNGTATNISVQIANGQTEQVTSVNVKVPSSPPSAIQLFGEAAVEGLGAFLEALVGISGPVGAAFGGLVVGAGATLASDFIDQASVPGYQNLTVPVTPITNNILNASVLSDIATNVTKSVSSQWQNIQQSLSNTTFVDTYLSNFGLLEALQAISGSQLSPPSSTPGNPDPTMSVSPNDAATDLISRLSWSTMIPAVFHWSEAPSLSTLPAANGQTTLLSNTSVSLNGPQNQNGPDGAYDVITGHFFQGDTNLDLAVANYDTSDVSILRGNGAGTFTSTWPPASLGGPDYPEGIAVGKFVNGTGIDDLAVTTNSHVVALINNGNGQFTPKPAINLGVAGNSPPQQIAVDDFFSNGIEDLAVTSPGTNLVSILKGDGQGNFSLVQNLNTGLLRPWGIATGDFDHSGTVELAVSYQWSDAVGILKLGSNGQFALAYTIALHASSGNPHGLVVGDFNGDGNLDIAVADHASSKVSILLGDGKGNFQVNNIDLDSNDNPEEITLVEPYGGGFPDLAVSFVTNDSQSTDSGVALLYNRGDGSGSFFAPVSYLLNGDLGAVGARGIVDGNFLNNGMSEIVVANEGSDDLSFISGSAVGNFVGFQPGTSSQDTAVALGNMEYLQGGNDVAVGPINSTSTITPSTSSPPNYLGFISLPYYPDAAPLDVTSPGYFLSVTPALMQQSASGFSSQQSGSIITGWQLLDTNNNPIAESTLQDLFGVPRGPLLNGPTDAVGTDLAPVNPNQPYAALNGGWYYAAQPAPYAYSFSSSAFVQQPAYATWADAFFNWGQGISGYSPRNLIPYFASGTGTGQTTGTLSGTSTTFPSGFGYTITYSPETTNPPSLGIPVDLSADFNRNGIVTDGVPYSGGLGGSGYAFSAQSLPRYVIFNGVSLALKLPSYIYQNSGAAGATDGLNVVSAPARSSTCRLASSTRSRSWAAVSSAARRSTSRSPTATARRRRSSNR